MGGSLERGVVLILRQKWLAVAISASLLSGPEAERHLGWSAGKRKKLAKIKPFYERRSRWEILVGVEISALLVWESQNSMTDAPFDV